MQAIGIHNANLVSFCIGYDCCIVRCDNNLPFFFNLTQLTYQIFVNILVVQIILGLIDYQGAVITGIFTVSQDEG